MSRNGQTKKIVLLMCVMLILSALTSCGDSQDANNGEIRAKEPEVETVRLAAFSHGHVLNAIAEKQGYLEEEGITVEYVFVNTDDEAFAGIENGTIDVASNSGTNLPLQRIAEGQDLTIFGGYLLTGCMPIFAKVDTEWNSVEDLIGKTMACESNLYAISGPLMDMGHDPLKDVKWYPTEDEADRIKAVKEGKADYALVGTRLNYAINSDPELKVCTYASDILPAYSCCRVEGSTDWVRENPNTVMALLRAWIRAQAYYDNHHEEVVQMMMEITGEEEAFLRAYMDNPHCVINVDPMKVSVNRAWDYMDRLGLLSASAKKIDIDEHINADLYKQALDDCQTMYGDENPKFYEEMQELYARNDLAIDLAAEEKDAP